MWEFNHLIQIYFKFMTLELKIILYFIIILKKKKRGEDSDDWKTSFRALF